MKYVVTAINNATGEREAISSPHSRWKADALLLKAKRMYKGNGRGLPYRKPRVDEATEDGTIVFEAVF